MGQTVIGEDGLSDLERNQEQWLESDVDCYSCREPINFGDSCVALRLVYPAPHTGHVLLLDALEEDGSPTAEPLIFCFSCWSSLTEEVEYELRNLFQKRGRPGIARSHPAACGFCHEPVGWGDYIGHAVHGELDVSPRTHETSFKQGADESVDNAELICMECLAWLNDDLDENIWLHLWMPDEPKGAPYGSGEEGQQGL